MRLIVMTRTILPVCPGEEHCSREVPTATQPACYRGTIPWSAVRGSAKGQHWHSPTPCPDTAEWSFVAALCCNVPPVLALTDTQPGTPRHKLSAVCWRVCAVMFISLYKLNADGKNGMDLLQVRKATCFIVGVCGGARAIFVYFFVLLHLREQAT